MATMNISLPDQMKAFAEAQARDGQYGNVSDYVRDLIRRDQKRKVAMAEVQAMIDEGIASGPARPFSISAFLDRKAAGTKA